MRIGEISKRLGISPKTLRYWEEIGLIPPPPRNSSGYRVFTEDYLRLCQFILKAKSVGFSLREIKQIVSIKYSGKSPCRYVEERLREKIREIDKLMEELRFKRKVLVSLLEGERGPSPFCPIIEGGNLKG